jgi:branched-chain amino acid transport system ATP-binding protein
MMTKGLALVRHPMLWFAVALALLPFAVVATVGSVLLATEIACFALLAIAFNVLLGQTGLLSFGHGLYFGLGAYGAALLQIHVLEGHTLLPIVLATVGTGLVGLVTGSLILRKSSGVYFSLITLAFGMAGFYLVYRATDVTGGENGLGGFGPTSVFGIDLLNRVNYYYTTAVVVLIAALLIWRFTRSPFGQVLRAVKENEDRVRALGYSTYRYKLVAFVVSTTFTALAGALYVYALYFTFPTLFHASFSGQVAAFTILGGTGVFLGPTVGALFFVYVRETLSSVTEHWMFFFGLLFMAFILFSPQGISGLWMRLWNRIRGKRPTDVAVVQEEEFLPSPGPTSVGIEEAAADGGTAAVAQPSPPVADGRKTGDVILSAEKIVKRFEGFAAVSEMDLRVREGTIHGLIGPNGAGKTTFFNCLSGTMAETSGKVVFRGRDITDAAVHEITQLGMARSFQIVSVFKDLTVADNVRVAVQAVTEHRAQVHTHAAGLTDIATRAEELIDQMGLAGKEDVPAGVLSHGDQRLLDIALALASDPSMLLLDEPFAGLPSAGRDAVTEVVRRLNREQGMTILLIEHDIERIMALADVITVLSNGSLLAEGPPGEVRNNPDVQKAYMGEGQDLLANSQDRTSAPVLLELKGVDAFYEKSQALERVSLRVHEGEVVCLLGRNGAGKTTTLMSIMGAVSVQHGSITFAGKNITNRPSEEVARAGIGLVPQGRRVFGNLSVADNLKLAAREGGSEGWSLERVYTRFPTLERLQRREAGNLSGGERQMLAIGRALVGNARLVLLDEPFEGLAQIVVSDIVEIIRELRGELTILLVEQSFELALSLADRAYVISNGEVVFEGSPESLLADQLLGQRLMGV